ncbi:Eco57I restriction-modification methylase domain-containing protein, partial [Dictyoglomus sp.]|uniref:Eco57I restriction-modification methylase domain-containing protein n=1 Tax=Dictyoglomus sp. TaxID=28205 RepID=UPI003D0E6BDA
MREAIEDLARGFTQDKLKRFLRAKNGNFEIFTSPLRKKNYEGNVFDEVYKIGDLRLEDNKKLVVYSIKVSGELSERNSKKKQYDLAKEILKDTYEPYDAGIFVFHDKDGNFRFSLVYKKYSGAKINFSYYKRYTYFVGKNSPYRTFVKALYNAKFESLEDIISAFSIQPLTKEFYAEIQNWYAWALKYAKFPGGKPEENIIRLITRLIFVWFIKQRDLIPDKIFKPEELKNIVKNFGNGDYYYNVILQNLFFAVLNKYPYERAWAKDEGYPKNRETFGVKTLFRYEKFLLIPEKEFIKIFDDVPFINGGLFECLDDDKNYIDGFSRREDKRARIPDFLFFSEEREEDLSFFYGDGKKEKVRGIINILKDYNFTADENSPIDIEVSLDPELLGHIFENLLAAYNPETQTTARKATGSYYTPKEIVDFMSEEALIFYLKDKTSIDEEKLRTLLSYSEEVNLTDGEKKELIEAIDKLKVLDPAVGSGAFPMGILHKLVYLLNRIDLYNTLWKKLQDQKALKEVEKILKIKAKEEREKRLKEINEIFDENISYPDYARKLYLIENSLYGVDIQPIAIQICKLRFFLSLIIDQKIDKNKENYGIRPLPHLETKFVSANTLIELEKPKQMTLAKDDTLERLKSELKELYKEHFRLTNREEKANLRKKINEIKSKIKEELSKNYFSDKTIEEIISFDLLSQTQSANWFDPEWMFGIDDRFDIVIGNPPYVRQERIKDQKPILEKQGYEVFTSTADLYVYFYEKGYQLLKEKGVLSYISSNKWMRAKYGEKLRKFLKENTKIVEIIDFSGYSVFEQTVDTNIILFQKERPNNNHQVKFVNVGKVDGDVIEYIRKNQNKVLQEKLSENAWTLADEKVLALKEKIEKIGKPLKDWDVKIYRGVLTGFNEAFIIDTETRNRILANCKTEEERKRTEEIIKPVLRGRDIGRYYYKWAGLWIIYIPWHFPLHN